MLKQLLLDFPELGVLTATFPHRVQPPLKLLSPTSVLVSLLVSGGLHALPGRALGCDLKLWVSASLLESREQKGAANGSANTVLACV